MHTESISILALIVLLGASCAHAGEIACRIQNGVVLAPARVAGVDGEFILDPAAPATILDATRASTADISGDQATGPVTVVGLTRPPVTARVIELDDRTRNFPTPVAGVLGSDVLGGLVVDIQPQPCRLGLYAPGEEPQLAQPEQLSLTLAEGTPYLNASVSDGRRAEQGLFALALGSDLAVRLSPTNASLAARTPAATTALDALAPDARARLPASLQTLLIGRTAFETVSGGLLETPSAHALGEIGAPVWLSFDLRIDYPRRTLSLTPLK